MEDIVGSDKLKYRGGITILRYPSYLPCGSGNRDRLPRIQVALEDDEN